MNVIASISLGLAILSSVITIALLLALFGVLIRSERLLKEIKEGTHAIVHGEHVIIKAIEIVQKDAQEMVQLTKDLHKISKDIQKQYDLREH